MMKRNSKQRNLTWFKGSVCREQRETLNGHKGSVVWFTGLSASGKSTLAHILEKELHERGFSTYVLDGDNVRHGLCQDLGFCSKDRVENMRRVGELVRLFVDAGIIVITAFISPYRKDRDIIRSYFGRQEFMEVYLKCPVDVCAQRDKKGLYAQAISSEISQFTGISAPYEEPKNPEIKICTDKVGAMQATRQVIRRIEENGIIPCEPNAELDFCG